jgi:DNA-binding MarR family transcriptional regulator
MVRYRTDQGGVRRMEPKTEQLVDLLQAVHKGIFEHIKDVFQESETPATQMMIMHQIAKSEGITVSELSRRLGLAKSHVSKTVDELASGGHVEKRPDPADGRILRLYRTPLARAHFDRMQLRIRAKLSNVVEAMPAEKSDGLIEGLRLLLQTLDQARQKERRGN